MNKNKKILLVDDEPDLTLTFKVALEEEARFEVEVYNDSVKALSNFKVGYYDLLLADIRMTKLNGYELCRKIKEIDNRIKEVGQNLMQ